jgi:hypothetical protein
MKERKERIIVRFACWAAASAARQGCDLKGRKWYEHLGRVDLASLFALPAPVSPAAFSTWHQREVEGLAAATGVPIGWAAKMVNMLTKVHVYIACRGDASLHALIHPPVDNLLVDAVKDEFPLEGSERAANTEIRELCSLGKPISGVTSYGQYLEVIRGLTLASQRLGCTIFELEELWRG